MQSIKFVFVILVLAISASTYAQDKIYKRNGEVVSAKIKNVGIKTITYVRFDNQSGPEYTIIKNEVDKIVYQNGSEDVFESLRPVRPSRHHHMDSSDAPDGKMIYKQNLLCLAPVQLTENGLGFGLSYERSLDKKGIVAFYIPVALTFNLNNGTYYDPNSGAYQNGKADAMFYAMPGVKVYPTGCGGLVKYAIGPSVVIGDGTKSSANYDPYGTGGYLYQTQTHTVLGMIVNNSLNINPTPHIYLGIEFGFGFTYLNRIGGINQGTEGLVQGSFKIGYRF